MGLLDKLWDDTLAGPQPETGLGRLRKPAPLTFRSISGKDYGGDLPEEKLMVTRSIMIKKPAGYSSPTIGTPPASPAGTTPPVSPFSGMSTHVQNGPMVAHTTTGKELDR
ncbi:hypothetical protein M5K25_002227 [Dendrobium thyrsiflorum]|uniref:Uncharacterized protein n=1 Tax=Dendrobium thyrsiflorum TaxID=117978 RepID=A0ABD0W4X6_DENTH